MGHLVCQSFLLVFAIAIAPTYRHHGNQIRLCARLERAALSSVPEIGSQRRCEVSNGGRKRVGEWDLIYYHRQFLLRTYPTMKKHNPHTPILIREALDVQPKVWARYGMDRMINDGRHGMANWMAQSTARRRQLSSMVCVKLSLQKVLVLIKYRSGRQGDREQSHRARQRKLVA